MRERWVKCDYCKKAVPEKEACGWRGFKIYDAAGVELDVELIACPECMEKILLKDVIEAL